MDLQATQPGKHSRNSCRCFAINHDQEKHRHTKKFDRTPERITSRTKKKKAVPVIIPEIRCDDCPKRTEDKGRFDEDGFFHPNAVVQNGRKDHTNSSISTEAVEEDLIPFRFFDLPAEIRNQIYEYAVHREGVVCVPDLLLRPSSDFPDANNILRACSKDIICLPCQFHDLLGTGHLGLFRANKQLHDENVLTPYIENTFKVHNLYYLNVFLKIVGAGGRKALRSLHFIWKLPEEEAHSLQIYTDIKETYDLLAQCCHLTELHVELDIINLLTWCGNGNPRPAMLNYMQEIPSIELMYRLRGLKDIKISWKHIQGLEGMEVWARTLAGYWCMPYGTPDESAVAVDEGSQIWAGESQKSLMWTEKERLRRIENALARYVPTS